MLSSVELGWDHWIGLASAAYLAVVLVRQMIAVRREKYEEIDLVGTAGGHEVTVVRSGKGEVLVGITFSGYRTGRLRAYLTPEDARRFAAWIRPGMGVSPAKPGHIL